MAKKRLHHILEAQQFTRQWLEEEFFPETKNIKKNFELKKAKLFTQYLKGKSVCLLFYEPSTRTRISFGQAAGLMGAHVESTENAKDFSSTIKGESLIDTIRVVNALNFDAVVLRSDFEGGAIEAASVSKIPVINAGDGPGQHPTQALLDVYTIFEHFKTLDNLTVALVGDLKHGRTTRSLAYLLSKFKKIRFELVAPRGFEMKTDILDYLKKHQISFNQVQNLKSVAGRADVLYLTRVQKERMKTGKVVDGRDVSINDAVMKLINPKSILMHPLPRSKDFDEIPERFTNDPRVVIFQRQVRNGLYTRMALLKMILG